MADPSSFATPVALLGLLTAILHGAGPANHDVREPRANGQPAFHEKRLSNRQLGRSLLLQEYLWPFEHRASERSKGSFAMTVTDSVADIATPTGPMRTYFYAPHDPHRVEKRPGLVLYSEIFQQTPPVRRLAVTFASLGYLVAVPEVYHAHAGRPGAATRIRRRGKGPWQRG